MKEYLEKSASERLSILLGLAAKKNGRIDICPPPQHLALFIDGQLKKKMRKQMLAHLNECENCRSIWLETATYLESKSEPNETVIGQKIVQGIRRFLTPGPLILSGVVAAILFLVVVIPDPNINHQIDSSYEMLSSKTNQEVFNVAKKLTMPWDNPVKAFSKTNIQAEKNAFGAGIWQGKNKLIFVPQALPSRLTPPNKGHWQDTDWAYYYQFGRLVVLLWVESQVTTQVSDWGKYKKTLIQLHKNLATRPDNTELTQSMLLSIEQVTAKIERLNDKQNKIEKKPLQRSLEIIMQKFSPG